MSCPGLTPTALLLRHAYHTHRATHSLWQGKARVDVNAASEQLHTVLVLLESEVVLRVNAPNGKRQPSLALPPVEALRSLHPLAFALVRTRGLLCLADSGHACGGAPATPACPGMPNLSVWAPSSMCQCSCSGSACTCLQPLCL